MLVAIGSTDLAHSLGPSVGHRRFVPGATGALATLVLGLLAGLGRGVDLVAVLVLAAVACGWELAVRTGFGSRRAWLPLACLAGFLGLAVIVSGSAPESGGPLGRWVAQVPLPVLSDLDADGLLLLLG